MKCIVMVDISGSMFSTLGDVKQASEFTPDCLLGIFGSKYSFAPGADFEKIRAASAGARRNPALYDMIIGVADRDHTIIIFTDSDSDSSAATLNAAQAALEANNAHAYILSCGRARLYPARNITICKPGSNDHWEFLENQVRELI